jgi:hypothetical protein
MEDNIIYWMSYGFVSFYFAGRFLGARDNNLKNIALVGLVLGGIREFTGKDIIYLFLKE